MKLRHKVIAGVLGLAGVALVSMAIALSYDADCGPAPVVPDLAGSMAAIVYRCYGSPDVLELAKIPKPTPGEHELLVRVRAASVNPLDWHYMRGSPYLMRIGSGLGRPRIDRLGVDFAGTVEAVGKDVARFRPGDEVFGGRTGAFAQYVTVQEDRAVVPKPPNVSFEQAAAVPIAAITALQALRDKGGLQSGQSVLINGASGGVGTFAVQIARSFGAEVTGVCSTRNVELVRSLGADHVIDYTREDYTSSGRLYDLIIDNVGNHPPSANRRVLKPGGVLVMVGGPSGDWLKPLLNPAKALMLSPFVDQKLVMFLAQMRQDDLSVLGDLMQSGKLTPVIDRSYRLSEVAEAIRYSEEGHSRGKIVVIVE